jgi:multicomponent Na+:H+ antiporter subunit G
LNDKTFSPLQTMNETVTLFLQLVAIAAVIVGTFFSVVGVLGLIRLPDVYTRLQATGKVGVLGVVFLLIAVATRMRDSVGPALVLILLLLIVGPSISHAISSAGYRFGIPMKGAVRDDLARDAGRADERKERGDS